MAKLFLSYSRKDESIARRLTRWLEQEGHDVWRDEDDIGGGASFSSEIETALKDSDAILVVWSAQAIQSAWVRDEAAFGRDAGKLIPFSLGETEPPLGFRQFQSIALSRWRGNGEPPSAERIRAAIARLDSVPRRASGDSRAGRPPGRSAWFRRSLIAAGALTLAVVGATAFLLWRHWSADRDIVIAVVPSAQSSDRAMAADYANAAAADMAAFLPRRFDRASVIGPADASGGVSGYRMLISTDPRGSGANVTLALSDEDGRTTLWSHNWSVPDASASDLKADVSALASKAALCLTEARGGDRRLSQPALGLYLGGCTELGEAAASNEEFERTFERVTKLEPKFAPAWDYLALGRSWIASSLPGSSPAHAAADRNAREAIAVARKLNPNSAMSYDAEYHLIRGDTFRALRVLEQGAKIDPDDGRVQMHLSYQLLAVGRLSDSVAAAQRSIELEPISPFSRSQYIQALVYSGEFSKAKAEIAQARKKWPNDQSIDSADFTLELRYGDPRAALDLLPRIADASDAAMDPYRTLIAARLDPTPKNVDEAISAFTPRNSDDPFARNDLLLALGNFGRVDQVFQLLQDPSFQPFVDLQSLFRPAFAPVRADPRFMQVAARLGLVRYWRQSGYWPDFCTSEQLKYDCKKEAAKYAA